MNDLKRYLLNKINKISQVVHKKHIEPIKILCVHETDNQILATLTYCNEQPDKKKIFYSEEELNKYIKDNKIQNIIRNICIEAI